jgi:hypothetical protein
VTKCTYKKWFTKIGYFFYTWHDPFLEKKCPLYTYSADHPTSDAVQLAEKNFSTLVFLKIRFFLVLNISSGLSFS